jgi:hypothetical protein
MDIFFYNITQLLKPIHVEGYLDDLIGKQIINHILIFILVISLIFLFIFYIINNIFILKKDQILNKFINKYIKFYIQYHSFFAKLSLIYLPILILIGLLILTHGFYFLMIHKIPYDSLDIDLHTDVS